MTVRIDQGWRSQAGPAFSHKFNHAELLEITRLCVGVSFILC
jgi:hypothetical protein